MSSHVRSGRRFRMSAVVREVCPALLKLAIEMGADMGGNHRRNLDQILSRERIYTRCPNNLRGPS